MSLTRALKRAWYRWRLNRIPARQERIDKKIERLIPEEDVWYDDLAVRRLFDQRFALRCLELKLGEAIHALDIEGAYDRERLRLRTEIKDAASI